MDKPLSDTIGNTIDTLVQPRVAPPPDGVLRVAVLRPGDTGAALIEHVENAGLRVAYINLGEEVGVISDQSVIPPFDLILADASGDEWTDVFDLVLRFLRGRRPVAFLLVSGDITNLLATVRETTQRMKYKISVHVVGDQSFIVGALDNAEDAETLLWQIADAIASSNK